MSTILRQLHQALPLFAVLAIGLAFLALCSGCCVMTCPPRPCAPMSCAPCGPAFPPTCAPAASCIPGNYCLPQHPHRYSDDMFPVIGQDGHPYLLPQAELKTRMTP